MSAVLLILVGYIVGFFAGFLLAGLCFAGKQRGDDE